MFLATMLISGVVTQHLPMGQKGHVWKHLDIHRQSITVWKFYKPVYSSPWAIQMHLQGRVPWTVFSAHHGQGIAQNLKNDRRKKCDICYRQERWRKHPSRQRMEKDLYTATEKDKLWYARADGILIATLQAYTGGLTTDSMGSEGYGHGNGRISSRMKKAKPAYRDIWRYWR